MPWKWSTHGDWYYCQLMGVKFRLDAVKFGFLGRPRDESLKLAREPNNSHDPNAIGVLGKDTLIGYLPRDLAAQLAPRMDVGEKFICLIVDSSLEHPCIRIKPHPVQSVPKDHPWEDQLPNHTEDTELESRRHEHSYYACPTCGDRGFSTFACPTCGKRK